MRALVVDDEAAGRRLLGRLLRDLGHAVVAEASTGAEALAVLAHRPVDAAFLDIRLPDLDGLAVGDRCRQAGIPVVFVTGFPDYALPAYDVPAVDYLVKPPTLDRLGRALARLRGAGEPLAAHGGAAPDRLCLRVNGEHRLIAVRHVLAARADGAVVTFRLEDGSLRARVPLGRLEQLLAPHGFFRCHRAYLVNLRRVRRIVAWSRDAHSLLLDDAQETLIPLAKSRRRALRAFLLWP